MAKVIVAKRRHYDVGNPPYEAVAPKSTGSGAKVRSGLPPEVIHKIMMKSRDGGRGRCECCLVYFSMNYMTLMRRKVFEEPTLVCGMCKKEHPEYRKVDKLI